MAAGIPRWGWVTAVIVSLLVSLAVASVRERRPPRAALEIEMMSSRAGKTQLFFDVGAGYNERDSQWQLIGGADQFFPLRLNLPNGTYRHLRFDPLNTAGVFQLRNMRIVDSKGRTLHQFKPSDVRAFHDISRIDAGKDQVQITTIDNTLDPGVELAFDAPLTIGDGTNAGRGTFLSVVAGAITLAVCLLIAFLAARWNVVERLGDLADRAGRRCSSDFMEFDRPAILFLGIVTLVFGGLAVAGIHGSSMAIMHDTIMENLQDPGPLLGTPKAIRSDEWARHTPAILYQLERPDFMSPEDSMLGPGPSALVSNLPSRHITTWFRPQFFVFLLLPRDYAFSFYWQFKSWVMLAGMFLLVLLFTRSSWAAIVGTTWLYFSNEGQWWFSTPASQPEMIGLFGLTLVGACYLVVGRRTWLLLTVAVATAACAINLALSLYIPFLIPLTWLGAPLFAAFILARREQVFRRDHRAQRIAALVLCLLVTAAMIGKFYIDARPGLQELAATRYPGQRSLNGGTATVVHLLSHAMNLWETEYSFPPAMTNVCEAAGVYWFAPLLILAAFVFRNLPGDRLSRYGFIAGSLFLYFMLVWNLLPIPAQIGSIFLLNKTHAIGAYVAMSVANVYLTVAYLYLFPAGYFRGEARSGRSQWALAAGLFALILPTLVLLDVQFAFFWKSKIILLAATLLTGLIFCLITRRRVCFAVLLIVPFIYNNTLINPIDRGFKVIDQAALHAFAHNPEYRKGQWIVFSGHFQSSAFFSAQGLDVFNGSKYLPPISAFRLFDPDGRHFSKYNQSGVFLATNIPVGSEPSFVTLDPWIIDFRVSAADPRLRQLHIRYAAFDDEPDAATIAAAHLRKLTNAQIDGFWLYEYADLPSMDSNAGQSSGFLGEDKVLSAQRQLAQERLEPPQK